MSIEFPLGQKQTPFGLLSDPRIPVRVPTLGSDSIHQFLVDTGADFSMAPRRLAVRAGLEWATLTPARVVGVEQDGIEARLGRLPIRVADVSLAVRCLFVDGPGGLFILGRADFMEHFVLTIDHQRQRIILEEPVERTERAGPP